MEIPEKKRFILVGAILVLVIIACSFPTITPTQALPPPPATTIAPVGTATSTLTATPTPTASITSYPIPELEGSWQISNRVYTIAWQNDQFVVTSIIDSMEGSLEITSQSWAFGTLTWTYYRPSIDRSITFTTAFQSGDNLFINYSNSSGASGTLTLRRAASAQPSYYSLPYVDDFSDPDSGWDIFDAEDGSTGYGDGYYYSISKLKNLIETGYAYRFFGDTVIELDATSVSGYGNAFGYVVNCRLQSNYASYAFEVDADGYYSVWVFTDSDTSTSLLSGDEFQFSNAINQDLATNHLVVTCAGDLLKLEVNGQVLFEGHDSTYTEGDLGLGAITWDENNTPAEVHFDNLVVRAP